jgi:hypothetical protein
MDEAAEPKKSALAQACSLSCSSPNASRPRDVLGTLMLGILSGAKRYAHIAGVPIQPPTLEAPG